jgi:sulfatase-modifying factor enzyme 1
MIYAGSPVFSPPRHPVSLRDFSQWWTFAKGSQRRHPYGPGNNIRGLDDYPVVHVAFSDALAYATWAGEIYRQRRSGNSQRAVGSPKPISFGATSSRRSAVTWQPPGRENFLAKILLPMVSSAPRR